MSGSGCTAHLHDRTPEAWLQGALQAFGAAGALEAAYYRATGKPTLFSEQMLVDCTWDLPEGELSNKGCYGEQPVLALQVAVSNLKMTASRTAHGQR